MTTDTFTLEEELDRYYSQSKLTDIFNQYLRGFIQTDVSSLSDWTLNWENYKGLSIRKKDIIKLFTIILSDSTIFDEWKATLPFYVLKVMETLVWEGKKEIRDLNHRTKNNLISETNLSGDIASQQINPDYCLFLLLDATPTLENHSVRKFLFLPNTVRKKLKAHLPFPVGYHIKPLRERLPTKFEFQSTTAFFSTLPLINSYISQGNLKFSKSGIPLKSSLRHLNSFCELKEFFEENSDADFRDLRLKLIVRILSLNGDQPQHLASPDLIKKLLNTFLESRFYPDPFFLSHLKGWSATSAGTNEAILPSFHSILKQMPLGKWISVKQIKRFIQVREIDISPVNRAEAERYLYLPSRWKGWGNVKKPVTEELYEPLITDPLIKTLFFLFASFGLVDIAYDFPENPLSKNAENPYITVFDGLRYLRLTDLGAFIIDQKDRFLYETVPKEQTRIHLETDRLIFTTSRSDKLIELLLERLSIKIGKNRYKVDFPSFIQESSSREEVLKKIELFKKAANKEIPAIWKTFFDNLLHRVNPLLPREEWKVFHLSPDNQEFIELLENDTEIRQRFLKAENYHIIIRQEDFSEIKKRIEHRGYLFDQIFDNG